MKNKKERDQSFYSIENVQSATECTGVMPAMPETMEGQENLSEMMAIHCPPGAMAEGSSDRQWERAVADPSDVHSSLTKKAVTHRAMSPAPSHPPQAHNQHTNARPQARDS